MLHFLRQRKGSKLVWVGLAMIIGVFVFFGIGAGVGGNPVNTVATVGGKPISPLEIQRAEANLLNAYRDAYKERFTPEVRKSLNLRQRALDTLIDRQVLANHADALGIRVSDQELVDTIAGNPNFQIDGRFNKEGYIRVLRNAGFTPGDYEQRLREELAIERLQALVTDGVQVSDAVAREDILMREEKVAIEYVKVKASDFTMQVPVTDDDLRAFYEANKARYTDPERVKIEMIAYPAAKLEATVKPTDAEVQAYYDEHVDDRFKQAHEVRARHILIQVKEDSDEETRTAARKKIDELAAKVKGGADFAKLATENSQDEGSAKQGGDLGFFGKGRMVPPFESAAFALAPGQVSEVVESPFGFHLIKVEEVREERVKPIEEVRPEIEKTLAADKASAAAKVDAEADRALWVGGKPPAEIAEARGLTVQTPPPLQRNDTIPGLGRSFPLSTALWALEPGGITEAIDVNGNWVVARLVEKLPPTAKEFDAVKDQVETAYRLEKATVLARTAAEGLLAAARTGGSLEKAATAEKREVEKSEPFTRVGGPYIPGIGASADVKDAAFRLTEADRFPPGVFDVAGDSIVIQLVSVEQPSPETVDEKLGETRDALLEKRRGGVFTRYLQDLKASAEISVDPLKLEQMPVG